MKKFAVSAVVFGFMLFLNGCYTVVQGDYHYTDNSQTTTIIINNPVPPPPPPTIEPIRPIIPHPIFRPDNPKTKERIDPPKRNSGSSTDNNPRNTGGRDNGGRNGNSR